MGHVPGPGTTGHPPGPGTAGHPYSPGTGQTPPPGYATVTVEPSRQQLIGVRIGRVTRRSFFQTLVTVGLVTTDETRTTQLHVKFTGWVEDVFVDFVGEAVEKGQPLMSIYSPELFTAQSEYVMALQSVEKTTGSGTPRGVTAGTDQTGAEAMAASASQEMLEAARRRLRLWDIPGSEIRQLEKTRTPKRTLILNAPIAGTVLVRNVLTGMYVDPGTRLYTIADLSRVWVRAQIYADAMPYVKPGQEATITVEGLPGRTLRGAVQFIQPMVSETTRTNEVRFEFDNRDGSLKPNMFATVALELDMGEGLAVPAEAVIDTGVRTLVFVVRDDRTFEPREVKLGARLEQYDQVLEGLSEGERVVISAQFLIDSESQLKGGGSMGGHAGHGG